MDNIQAENCNHSDNSSLNPFNPNVYIMGDFDGDDLRSNNSKIDLQSSSPSAKALSNNNSKSQNRSVEKISGIYFNQTNQTPHSNCGVGLNKNNPDNRNSNRNNTNTSSGNKANSALKSLHESIGLFDNSNNRKG